MTDATTTVSPQSTAQILARMRWIIVLACLSITTVIAGLPIYSGQFQTTGLEIGGLYATSALMAAVSRPLFGRLLDRVGRKPVLLTGICFMIVSLVMFALSNGKLGLFFAQFLHGLGLGTILLAAYTITYDLANDSGRGSSFGLTEESQYRGGIWGAILLLPILLSSGWDPQGELHITRNVWIYGFALYGVGAVASLVLAWMLIPETMPKSGTVGASSDRLSFRDHKLNIILVVVLLTSASAYSIQPFILTFIERFVTSNVTWIGLAYVPGAIVSGLAPSRFGGLSDRVGRKPPMIVALSVSAAISLALVAFSFLGGWTVQAKLAVFAAFGLIEALAYAASIPAEQALVADVTGGKHRGAAFGMYTLAQSSGKVIGPLLMGGLSEGFKEGPFVVNAIILIIGVLIVRLGITEAKNLRASGRT